MNFMKHWMEAQAHLLVQDHDQAVPPPEILLLPAVSEQEASTLICGYGQGIHDGILNS